MTGSLFARPFVVVSVVAVSLLAACSGDGTSLTVPGEDGATAAPIVVPTEEMERPLSAAVSFQISSPAFEAGSEIPPVFTRRDGDDLSPPLTWSGVPEEATELVLVMTDPSADGFVHWVIWGLDPATQGIARGQVPPGTRQATNSFGEVGYGGPNPPEEDAAHVYLWRLFALDQPTLDVEAGIDGRTAITTLEARAIAIAEMFAFYG